MKPPPLGLSLDDACVSCNISSSSTINEVRFLLQELSIYHEIILGLEIVNLLFFFLKSERFADGSYCFTRFRYPRRHKRYSNPRRTFIRRLLTTMMVSPRRAAANTLRSTSMAETMPTSSDGTASILVVLWFE